MRKAKDINMTEGPIFSRLVLYTVPLMLSGILQLLYNAADLAVVGNFAADGETALAAVGSTGAVTNLIISLFLGLSVGACVVLSQYLGSNDERDSSEVVHTSMLASLIIGIVMSIVGIILARPMLQLMQTPDEVIDGSTLYMTIYFAGLPASMIYNFGSAILRAKGDTKYPLIVLIISGAVNVALNLVTVLGLHWDVAGVATATVASQVVSAIMVVIHLCRLDDCCQLDVKKLKLHKDKLIRIVRVGLPAGFQSVVFSISNVMLQSSVNVLGKAAMAGNTAASNIDGFIYQAQNSVYHAAMAFTGQNVGARNMKRVKRVCFSSVILVTAVGLLVGGIVFIFADPLLNLYAPGVEKAIARENGLLRLQITTLTYFLCGIMEVMTGILRGMGCSVTPMIIAMIGACGFRMFWVLAIFPIDYFHNMLWLYISYPISWGLTALAMFIALLPVYRRLKRRLTEPTPALIE